MRLDQYVAQYWPEYSRSVWQKFIKAGVVSVNGTVEHAIRHEVGEDDQVTIGDLPHQTPEKVEVPIIYEDDHVLVLNKPTGMLTHAKGELLDEFTLADFVLPRMTEPETTNRPGIVHRLDRDTSGVIIAAKDAHTKHLLQKQFQDRKAKKTYYALVWGTPKLAEALIDLPISRNPKLPSTFRIDPKGKSATTQYKVLESSSRMSLLELRPTTGRTHQLRVHMEYIGTPIVGDKLYSDKKSPIGRLCLHAHELEITIPTANRQTFTADIPKEFKRILSQ